LVISNESDIGYPKRFNSLLTFLKRWLSLIYDYCFYSVHTYNIFVVSYFTSVRILLIHAKTSNLLHIFLAVLQIFNSLIIDMIWYYNYDLLNIYCSGCSYSILKLLCIFKFHCLLFSILIIFTPYLFLATFSVSSLYKSRFFDFLVAQLNMSTAIIIIFIWKIISEIEI